MPVLERDPHAHRSVRIVNEAPVGFTWGYDGERITIPPAVYEDDQLVRAAEKIVPYRAACIHLGDPEAIDVGRNRYRTDEYRRVRVKAGISEFNEHFHCEPGTVPNSRFRHPESDKTVGQSWWTETGMPPITAYDPDTGQLLPCPAYDPEGTQLSTTQLALSENASLQEQVAFLQQQMQRLLAEQDDGDDDYEDDADEDIPPPEGPKVRVAPRRRIPKSESDKTAIGAQIAASAEGALAGLPMDG